MTLYAKLEQPWSGAIDALLAWICDGAAPVVLPGRWLLAHCDEGVVWGVRGDDDRWTLSTQVFPDEAPTLTAETLQQLRVFGEDGELLVWRHDDGLRARWLADAAESPAAWAKPDDEDRLLVGEHPMPSAGGFTLLRDATGARQVVPLGEVVAGKRPTLQVRHYFERDPESGAVRVAASRLVAVKEG